MTRLLLRFFPAAWRARYGKELLDLVSETGVTPRIAADLIRAGVAERARAARETLTGGTTMVLGPAWRHPRAWAIVGLIALLPTLSVIALSLVMPYQLERAGFSGIVNSFEAWLNTNRLADLFLIVSPPVAMLLAAAPLVRFGLTRVEGKSEASVSVRRSPQTLSSSPLGW